jgi:hypothetical protein
MLSYKSIKISDTDTILLKFYHDILLINIHTSSTCIELSKNHDEFNTVINELKNDLNISNHKIKLIRFWYNKNYKKYFPIQTYTTKSGRIINFN